MPLINGRWHVVKGDCMWNIARSVYGDGRKWPTIADANGVPRSNPVIYPNQVLLVPKPGSILYFTAVGDTLAEVAKGFKVGIDELISQNDKIYLQPEQLIVYKYNNK